MKKLLLLIFIIFVIAGDTHLTLSWDSTVAKYMPLQVGNTWVYTGIARSGFMTGRSYQIYKVIGTIDTMGKRYYNFERRTVMINGTIPAGVWQFGNIIRIDSATMNIHAFQPYLCDNAQDMIMDSLKARINDTTFICYNQFFISNSKCIDTSLYNIFNNNYPSKRFTEFFGPGYNTIYVKGIGIAYSSYGYSMNQSQDTLKGCVINGVLYGDTNTLVGINQISTEIPAKFSLSQNYPNPFNPATKLKFQMPNSGIIKLIVYDLLGKEVQTLVNQQLSPGTYEVDFDAGNLPSGVYYYKLKSGVFIETKKMVLIK